MTDGGLGPVGWQAIGSSTTVRPDPFAEWYRVWREQHSVRRDAEEAERARMTREIRWMSALIAVWSLVMGGAAALAIRILL